MVVRTEDDFGRSVESTLDVGVDCSTKAQRNESARSREEREEEVQSDSPFSCSKQLDPKSMTLIPLFEG